MLRSVGKEKVKGADFMKIPPTITSRCGFVRLHRTETKKGLPPEAFPADFTSWEQDVTCEKCQLPDHLETYQAPSLVSLLLGH